MSKILDEVKDITSALVAKQQDSAKLNFPKIINRIKVEAALGKSSCYLPVNEINEYDKALLETEGFKVRLVDDNDVIDNMNYYHPMQQHIKAKKWEIKW